MRVWGLVIALTLVLIASASAIDLPPVLSLQSDSPTVVDTAVITATAVDIGSTSLGIRWIRIFEDGNMIENKDCLYQSTCVAPKVVFHGPAGSHSYTAQTQDLGNNIANAGPISVTFTGTQTPPLIENVPDVSINEDSGQNSNVIDLHNFGSDLQDGDAQMTYSVSAQSNGALVSCQVENNRFIRCDTVLANGNGQSTVTVQLQDTAGATDTDDFVVTVQPVNDAPVLSGLSPFTLGIPLNTTATLTNLSLYFSDVENDPLTLEFSELGAFSPFNVSVSIGSINSVLITPAVSFTGIRQVTFTATDTSGASVTTTPFTFNISFNDPPVFTSSIGPLMLLQNQSAIINLSQFSVDPNGHNLTFNHSVLQNLLVQINNQTKSMNVTANSSTFFGAINFTLSVTDGNRFDHKNVSVFVVGIMAPLINFTLVNLSLPEDTSNASFVNLTQITFDVDNPVSFVNYTCNSSNVNVTVLANNVTKILSIDATRNFTGIINMSCAATDLVNQSSTASTLINVTPVNDAPQLIIAMSNVSIAEE